MADNFCMLAPAEWPHHNELKYPVMVQGKKDGVRALLIDKIFYSRNMKPIRNKMVQKIAAQLPNFMSNYVIDGEWWAPNTNFNTIQSIIMDSDDVLPAAFKHISWDCMGANQWSRKSCDKLYVQRLEDLGMLLRRLYRHTSPMVQTPLQRIITYYVGNPLIFARVYSQMLADGEEGAMVKDPSGKYKWGRATVREATMLKYKPTWSIDLPIHAVEEGVGKRKGMVGAFVVVLGSTEIRVGAGKGVTDEVMTKLWQRRHSLAGRTLEVYHSGVTPDGSFRFPKWKGIRLDK
jgi:ATP-dependent DNA ligase